MNVDYWQAVLPTYLENWPEGLAEMSLRQTRVQLSGPQTVALLRSICEYGDSERVKEMAEGVDVAAEIAEVRERVLRAIAGLPKQRAFVRLGSRSPKDSWLAFREKRGMLVDLDGQDPLRFILDASERMSDDLHLAIANQYCPSIFVREWIESPMLLGEWRCFFRDWSLVGISQYDYRKPCGLNGSEIARVEREISRWANEFIVASHLGSVVADVFFDGGVKLLEINPFFDLTDPCLFSWRKNDFDGSIRVQKMDNEKRLSAACTLDPLGGLYGK